MKLTHTKLGTGSPEMSREESELYVRFEKETQENHDETSLSVIL